MGLVAGYSPPRVPAGEVVTVLAVGQPTLDRQHLRRIFASSNWRLIEASTCGEAHAVMHSEPVGIVLCDAELTDGCWQLVLRQLDEFSRPPLLVVASRHADDHLWSEVLNLGGYDVLPQPYESREVVRVLSHAWRHWKSGPAMAAGA